MFPDVTMGPEVEKGGGDDRDYLYFTLPNKLRVIVVSDPETDKSAAALDVHVGMENGERKRGDGGRFVAVSACPYVWTGMCVCLCAGEGGATMRTCASARICTRSFHPYRAAYTDTYSYAHAHYGYARTDTSRTHNTQRRFTRTLSVVLSITRARPHPTQTGQLHDPVDFPGLAHFCEHLLFLGTEKYPTENAFNQVWKERREHGRVLVVV